MRRPIYDTVRLHVPFDRVAPAVRQAPDTWLPVPARPEGAGWVVSMDVPGVLSASVDTLVEVGTPDVSAGLVVVPVGWRGLRVEAAFPRLQADLEVEYVTSDATRLTLVGSYKPPLSVVGAAADRVVGHVVAEGVVRAFLEAVAERLRAAVDAGAAPTLVP